MKTETQVVQILKDWLQNKDDIVFTDDIAITQVASEICETREYASQSLSREKVIEVMKRYCTKDSIFKNRFIWEEDIEPIADAILSFSPDTTKDELIDLNDAILFSEWHRCNIDYDSREEAWYIKSRDDNDNSYFYTMREVYEYWHSVPAFPS